MPGIPKKDKKTIVIAAGLHKRVKLFAVKSGIELTDVVDRAIKEYLKKQQPKQKGS